MKAPAFMTLEELDSELQKHGYYRRERSTIDESLPHAKWVVIGSSGQKYGAKATLEVATLVLKLQHGTLE